MVDKFEKSAETTFILCVRVCGVCKDVRVCRYV